MRSLFLAGMNTGANYAPCFNRCLLNADRIPGDGKWLMRMEKCGWEKMQMTKTKCKKKRTRNGADKKIIINK